jgi:pimeloyl-ACP methyl ester carboxylesterase
MLIGLVLFLCLLGAVVAGSFWLVHRLTCPPRCPVIPSPQDADLLCEDLAFDSPDGLRLRGWWIAAETALTAGIPAPSVILVHPLGGCRTGLSYSGADPSRLLRPRLDLLAVARAFHRVGFNVFTFDLRAHGESAAGACAGGLAEDRDLVAAVDLVIRKVEDIYHLKLPQDAWISPAERVRRTPPVGVIAFGGGAAAAIAAVGRQKGSVEPYKVFSGDQEGGSGWVDVLPPNIKRLRFLVLVEPASTAMLLRGYLARISLVLAGTGVALARWANARLGGYPLDDSLLLRYAGQVNVPSLFVLAAGDSWGSAAEVERYYTAVPAPKEIWRVEGASGRLECFQAVSREPAPLVEFASASCQQALVVT